MFWALSKHHARWPLKPLNNDQGPAKIKVQQRARTMINVHQRARTMISVHQRARPMIKVHQRARTISEAHQRLHLEVHQRTPLNNQWSPSKSKEQSTGSRKDVHKYRLPKSSYSYRGPPKSSNRRRDPGGPERIDHQRAPWALNEVNQRTVDKVHGRRPKRMDQQRAQPSNPRDQSALTVDEFHPEDVQRRSISKEHNQATDEIKVL